MNKETINKLLKENKNLVIRIVTEERWDDGNITKDFRSYEEAQEYINELGADILQNSGYRKKIEIYNDSYLTYKNELKEFDTDMGRVKEIVKERKAEYEKRRLEEQEIWQENNKEFLLKEKKEEERKIKKIENALIKKLKVEGKLK